MAVKKKCLVSLSMVVLNSGEWPEKMAPDIFDMSKIHLKIVFVWKSTKKDYPKRRKFGVAKVWWIWRIDKICQTFIRQLTMRPRDVY